MKICAILCVFWIALNALGADGVPARPDIKVDRIETIDRAGMAEFVPGAEFSRFITATYIKNISRVSVSIDSNKFEKCPLVDVYLAVQGLEGKSVADAYVEKRNGKFGVGLNRDFMENSTLALHCKSEASERISYIIQLKDVEYAP